MYVLISSDLSRRGGENLRLAGQLLIPVPVVLIFGAKACCTRRQPKQRGSRRLPRQATNLCQH
jgi:hypothetical protein